MTDKEKFRYQLEHRMLPDMLYTQKINMLNAIIDKGGKFFSDIYLIYSPFAEILFTEDDFKIDAKCCQYDENRHTLYFLVVTMPKPTVTPLCERVYFCYEEKTDTVKYYTSEKSPFKENAICSWNEKGQHENFGPAPQNAEKEFQIVGNLFLKHIIDK